MQPRSRSSHAEEASCRLEMEDVVAVYVNPKKH